MFSQVSTRVIKENKIIPLFDGRNEKKAIELLYRSVWPQLLAFIKNHNGDRGNAEDLFHDAVMKLIKMIRNGEVEEVNDVEAYVFTMAKNSWYTKSKRDERIRYDNEQIQDLLLQSDDFENHGRKEKTELMDAMLTTLGDTCKELLQLTFYLDHSLKEAAEVLGLSGAEVAKTYQYRCKKKLFEQIRNNPAFRAAMDI